MTDKINSASFIERPTEYKAMQWDDIEASTTMMQWLQEQGMRDIQIVQRPLYSNKRSYIEYGDPDKMNKIFLGSWAVINTADGSSIVMLDHYFKAKYMQAPIEADEISEEEISDEPFHTNLEYLRDLQKKNLEGFNFNEVGVDLSVEFAKAKTEPVELKPVYEVDKNAEQPFTKLEPTMLSGLCLIKGELYGIRESDGSLDKINYGSQVFPNKPTITNITVHTANDKKRSVQPWPTQVTDSNGVVWNVAGDGMLEMPEEGVEPFPDCCGRDSEPETEDAVNLESDEMAESRDFQRDLSSLINRWSAEEFSGTPDFILAQFLESVLGDFNEALKARADWRGESLVLPALQRMQMNAAYGQKHKIDEPLGEDYIIEYMKHNELTVDKAAALLQQVFPMTKTEGIYQALTHMAKNGILFREQL